MMLVDARTCIAVALTLALTYTGLGRPLPFATDAPIAFAAGLLVFAAYLYLFRTLVRLPFALVITAQRARYAYRKYGLDRRESLRDGFVRGFLDTRRWTVGPLALIDRLAVIGLTVLATLPGLGLLLVRLGGMVGIALLIMLYLLRGRFALLVDEHTNGVLTQQGTSLPFLRTHD
ncbi:MAG: hypothetical protein JNJ61_01475 [Anaerolineae bacterium]|nr:hypothetical protein [Anaerolineae bacterium]